jgi:hypothetical protein
MPSAVPQWQNSKFFNYFRSLTDVQLQVNRCSEYGRIVVNGAERAGQDR